MYIYTSTGTVVARVSTFPGSFAYVIKKEIIVIKMITSKETKMGPGRRRPGPVGEIIT